MTEPKPITALSDQQLHRLGTKTYAKMEVVERRNRGVLFWSDRDRRIWRRHNLAHIRICTEIERREGKLHI